MINATGHITHSNGWECDAFLNTGESGGGYVLKDIRHRNWGMAADVRIVRVAVATSDPYKTGETPSSLTLGTPELPPATVVSESPQQDVQLIEPYTPLLELQSGFETRDPVLNDDVGKLKVLQHYVFTEYSNSPSHEPLGVLTAARFYPLVRFEFSKAKKAHAMYLRVDYRIEWDFNQYLDSPTRPMVNSIAQAGIFLDEDFPSRVEGAARSIIPGLKKVETIFKQAEKPLRFEVIGQGLRKSERGVSEPGDWDSIHQWPLQPMPRQQSRDNLPYALPSTPGAYHAAHTHWRWAKVAATGQILPKVVGGPQFAGLGRSVPGGPMIDPDNPNQSLRFAVTKAQRWGDEQNWSRHPLSFEELRTTIPGPESIEDGANLALLLSIEVFRDVTRHPLATGWSGTLCIHGIFFAHELEPDPVTAAFRRPIIEPGSRVERKWDRVP
jgi:hypothetical protein